MIQHRKHDWTGHILMHKCFIQDITEKNDWLTYQWEENRITT